MRILGIDPGLLHTGWAIIDSVGSARHYVASGVILPKTSGALPSRLNEIFCGVDNLCEQFSPDECSIEITFVNKNPKTTLILGHARAAAIVAVANRNISIYEYEPNKIKKATIDLTTELGHTPTKQEIAYRLGISVNKLNSIIKSAQSTISMETPANSSEDSSKIADFIVDDSTITPDSRVSQENLFEDIRRMLNQLSPKERDVLILRYGLDNSGTKKTLDEIGSQYGVSRERIRQIENRAIAKLKKLCKNKHLTVGLRNYFGE